MRSTPRWMTGASVIALSLALVGCGSSTDDATQTNAQATPTATTAAATATATSAGAAAGAEDKQICATADVAKKTFVSTLAKVVDGNGVVPPAEFRRALTELSDQLATINAADVKMATALKDLGASASALAGKADPINADTSAYEKAGDRFEALCKSAGWSASS